MTFWYWMYGAVTDAGIRADLSAMRRAGLAGAFLMPIRGVDQAPQHGGTARQLSPAFWQRVDTAISTADSLGLELGVHISDGFALAGGPWIQPEEAMQHIVFADTIVTGDPTGIMPRQPEAYRGYYEDIATYVLPLPDDYTAPDTPAISVSGDDATIDTAGVIRATKPCTITYRYKRPQTVRSVIITPGGNNIQSQRLALDTLQFTPPRQGWQNGSFPFTYAIPERRDTVFRFTWTPVGTEPGSEDLDAAKWKPSLKIKNITLSPDQRIDQWEGKTAQVWRIAQPTYKVPDLKPAIHKARKYRILRIGHTATGLTNATGGDAQGLECDKFTAGAVEKQLTNWFGAFMARPGAERVVRYMHIDSWECGSQNWCRDFAEQFRRRRGYDLMPYLPVMAGFPVESIEKSEAVLRDVRQTVNDLINDVFYATARRVADRYGCQLTAESIAPTMVADGMEHYRYVDMPMGEYWLASPTHDKPNDMRDAVSAAHIYGKNIIGAEACTQLRGTWDETPATVKPLIDRNLCMGINRVAFHVWTHNPWTDRRPGMTLEGIGLFFQRDQTWMPEARALTDYVSRCCELLQRGRPVADIAVYTGDEMPARAVLPERLADMLPGLVGAERMQAELARRANVGQPMAESPVGVKHAAGITDPAMWTNALRGYQYDSVNRDVLRQATITDSTLCLPSGARYKALVLMPGASNPLPAGTPLHIIDTPVTTDTLPGLAPDIILPAGIDYTHRACDDGTDIYFLANQRDTTVSFRPRSSLITHHSSLLYNPVLDTAEPFTGTVTLAPYASCFLIHTLQTVPASTPHSPLLTSLSLTEPWHLNINGATLALDSLQDWTTLPADTLRYFSGTATYTTTFRQKGKPQGRVMMSLGTVRDIAHVYVNGIDCGTAWTPPYEVDITAAVKKGRNTLRIDLTNTWANALLGAETGHAPFQGIWTNAKYRRPDKTLLPAGLLGPVTVNY